jgi:hypothetical protein
VGQKIRFLLCREVSRRFSPLNEVIGIRNKESESTLAGGGGALPVRLFGRLAYALLLRTLSVRLLAPGRKGFSGSGQISEVWKGLYLEAIKALFHQISAASSLASEICGLTKLMGSRLFP